MDVNSQPKYTMPVENYIAFVKGRLSYEAALDKITEKTCYSIVKDIALRESLKSLGGRLEPRSAII